MIYWFTGQPGSGKTTLGLKLKDYLNTPFIIDGDDLREILINKDYSRVGRENNIKTAQNIALYLSNKGYDVVVTLVSPYKELREEFKNRTNVKEIFVHTNELRGRENFHVSDYEKPTENFIEIDTTNKSVGDTFKNLLEHLCL